MLGSTSKINVQGVLRWNSICNLLFKDAVNYLDCIASKMDELMTMSHRRNGAESEKQKYSEKNMSQRHVVLQKSHIQWPGFVAGLPRLEGGD